MAIDPSAEYGAQVDTSDPTGYPQGQARNISSPGDGTGTPLERKWVSDVWGFEQALLAAAGITPSGTPDKVGASQYLEALQWQIANHPLMLPLAFASLPIEVATVANGGCVGLEPASESQYSTPDGAGISVAANTGGVGGEHVRMVGAGTKGVWRISIDARVSKASVADPTTVVLNLIQKASSDFSSGTTHCKQWRPTRYSVDDTEYFRVVGFHEFLHPGGDSPRYAIKSLSTDDILFEATNSMVYVTQLSRVL
jgi:hypothetical protein